MLMLQIKTWSRILLYEESLIESAQYGLGDQVFERKSNNFINTTKDRELIIEYETTYN